MFIFQLITYVLDKTVSSESWVIDLHFMHQFSDQGCHTFGRSFFVPLDSDVFIRIVVQ